MTGFFRGALKTLIDFAFGTKDFDVYADSIYGSVGKPSDSDSEYMTKLDTFARNMLVYARTWGVILNQHKIYVVGPHGTLNPEKEKPEWYEDVIYCHPGVPQITVITKKLQKEKAVEEISKKTYFRVVYSIRNYIREEKFRKDGGSVLYKEYDTIDKLLSDAVADTFRRGCDKEKSARTIRNISGYNWKETVELKNIFFLNPNNDGLVDREEPPVIPIIDDNQLKLLYESSVKK